MIYLDTHTVAGLYQADLGLFTPDALNAIEEEPDLRVSPMVVLELEYLHEIRRIKIPARRIMDALASEIGLKVCDAPFSAVIYHALAERWTRDPFDRLILAQAKLNRAKLITRDQLLQEHYSQAMG